MAGDDPTPVAKLTWLGQSCFVLESAGGARIVMDPIPSSLGYPLPAALRAHAVTISHEHGDHNNIGMVQGSPRVLRGITADKKGWHQIATEVQDVTIRSVAAYHDDVRGKKLGLNSIFVFEVRGVRVVHLGDLGHRLDDRMLSQLGSVDVVLIPVGGLYTLDARRATRVVDQLRPRLVVVPMHYKTDVLTIEGLASVEAFLAEKPNVRYATSNTLLLTGVKKRAAAEVVVLPYR
jgi:L-ascorbate metabolism protein UlaG (beta-lactamase superfamily)